MLIIPSIGIMTFIWHEEVFDFGLYQVNLGVPRNRKIFHSSEDIHGYLSYVLFGLIGLHLLAALWHHFIRRAGVLLRMWPARRGCISDQRCKRQAGCRIVVLGSGAR